MEAEKLTGILAAMTVFESLHGKFTKCVENLDKLATNEIVMTFERGEEYQVHMASLGAKKITDAIAFLCERVSAVDQAFYAALMFLQSELNEAQGSPELDLKPKSADEELEDLL